MMNAPFNNLTPKEVEILVYLAEECAEVIQIASKVLRHGMYSYHPDDEAKTPNKQLLCQEIADVYHAIDLLIKHNVLPAHMLGAACEKSRTKHMAYFHHLEDQK